MPREKEAYRDNLEAILNFTEGKFLLNIQEVADFCGIKRDTAKNRFFKDKNFVSAATLARMLS